MMQYLEKSTSVSCFDPGVLRCKRALVLRRRKPLSDLVLYRVHTHHYKGLTVHLADRFDQICFKLYASVDQGPQSKHFTDLVTLKPSSEELEQAKNWCISHDVSEAFAIELNKALEVLDGSD